MISSTSYSDCCLPPGNAIESWWPPQGLQKLTDCWAQGLMMAWEVTFRPGLSWKMQLCCRRLAARMGRSRSSERAVEAWPTLGTPARKPQNACDLFCCLEAQSGHWRGRQASWQIRDWWLAKSLTRDTSIPLDSPRKMLSIPQAWRTAAIQADHPR